MGIWGTFLLTQPAVRFGLLSIRSAGRARWPGMVCQEKRPHDTRFVQISSLEEIAYANGWISLETLRAAVTPTLSTLLNDQRVYFETISKMEELGVSFCH